MAYSRRITVLLCVSLTGFALQCSEREVITAPPEVAPVRTAADLTPTEISLAGSSNRFSLKLFRELANSDTESNLFVSPLSVSMALGMTYNGANGATRDEIQATLELSGLSLEETNQAYQGLIGLLTDLDPNVSFTIANSIWARSGLSLVPAFVDLNREYFDALVRELDFSHPNAADTINAWVLDNTGGKIDDAIEGPIDPELLMFLINAVYFKADWAISFDSDSTDEDDFYLSDNSTVSCPMMKREGDFAVLRQPTFSALEMPYGDSSFSMMVILPDEGIGVDAIVSQFSEENWGEWVSGLHRDTLPLAFPKFKIEYEVELNAVLKALGMNLAFTEFADFSNMIADRAVMIDKVKHKTFVAVDEVGTEAAAVTVVGIIPTSIPLMPSFVVNRPFLFVIYERVSGTILFMGRIVNPAAQ